MAKRSPSTWSDTGRCHSEEAKPTKNLGGGTEFNTVPNSALSTRSVRMKAPRCPALFESIPEMQVIAGRRRGVLRLKRGSRA